MSKMRLRPDVDGVVLRIREGTAFKRDDPHDHARLVHIFPKQHGLLLCVAPPSHDLGRPQPVLEEGEIL
jgi:hypothetical protein